MFRLGDHIVLRFDLFPSDDSAWRADLLAAQGTVARLAARVAVQLPVPLAVGEPGDGFPGFWAVYEWIPGETARESRITDLDTFAVDLAAFARALHDMPTDGRRWDGLTRGGPLVDRDVQVRTCIADSAALVDARRVEAVWDDCLLVPATPSARSWRSMKPRGHADAAGLSVRPSSRSPTTSRPTRSWPRPHCTPSPRFSTEAETVRGLPVRASWV